METRLAHQRRERGAVARDRRGHRLHDVVDVVEPGLDDGPAERLEARHVERDVVVDQEDRARPAAARVGDVRQDAREVEGVKVPAAHLDDRAETAVVGAAPGRFDDVDGPAQEGIAGQDAGGAVRQLEVSIVETAHGPRRRVREATCPEPRRGVGGRGTIAQPWDPAGIVAHRERAQERAERQLAFAADDEVDAARRRLVRLGRQARVVAAGDDDH